MVAVGKRYCLQGKAVREKRLIFVLLKEKGYVAELIGLQNVSTF